MVTLTPVSRVAHNQENALTVPVVLTHVAAGFPSPAEDFSEGAINIQDFLVKKPASTFILRVAGQSMRNAGILDKDYIVVDKSLTPKHNHIVVAVVHGEMTLKRLKQQGGVSHLCAEHPDYPDIIISDREPAEIWGVVVGTFRKTI